MAEIWGAVVGAVAIAGSTAYSANQAGKAGRAAQRGADAATGESARQYDQTRQDFAPWRSAGTGAINQLNSLFGLGGSEAGGGQWSGRDLIQSQGGIPTVDAERYANDPAYKYAWDQTLASERAGPQWRNQDAQSYYAKGTDADFARLNDSLAHGLSDYGAQHPQQQGEGSANSPNMSGFFTSPGYQFRKEEGTKGLERSAAARGGAFSGNALKALAEFNSGLASNEFGNYFNQLASIAGLGQTATANTSAAGANYANNAGRNSLYAGNARASGIENQANIIGQGINQLGGIAGYYGRNRQQQPQNNTIWEDG